jgi:hypothetical protein
MPVKTGNHNGYQWLEAEQADLETFIQRCSTAFVGKYIAVTAVDSGPLLPREADLLAGWSSNGTVAFSPCIASPSNLSVINDHGNCSYAYNEIYSFEAPPILGQIFRGNPFEAKICPENLIVFVNFLGFRFSAPDQTAITDMFWAQVGWMQPQCYIADHPDCLLFATNNADLFRSVFTTLERMQEGLL